MRPDFDPVNEGRTVPSCLNSTVYGVFSSLTQARNNRSIGMKIKVVVHDADEGGFWAEVPAIPGCATQGETMDELIRNLHEAIEGCLAVDVAAPKPGGKERILEIAL